MVTRTAPRRAKFRLSQLIMSPLVGIRRFICRHNWRPSRTNYGHSICKHCGAVARI